MKRIIFFILVLNICMSSLSQADISISDPPSNIPKPFELKNRIAQLYKAESKKDWNLFYNLTVHKNEISYEEFIKKFSYLKVDKDRLLSGSTQKYLLKHFDKNERNIEIGVMVRMQGISNNSEPQMYADYWFFIDGTWYWAFRGMPIG